MFWKEFLQNSSFTKMSGFDFEFYPPANEINLEIAEKKLGVKFPQELRNLYLEMNGVGLVLLPRNQQEKSLIGYLICPLEQMITKNLHFRTDLVLNNTYRSFENILFFSDAGNGDQYGYLIKSSGETNNQILRWDHEDDERRSFAGSLQEFFYSY